MPVKCKCRKHGPGFRRVVDIEAGQRMNEQRRQIEAILSAMLSARKCVQLYPSGNPTISQALGVLSERLNAFLKSLEKSDAKPAGAPDVQQPPASTGPGVGFLMVVDRDTLQIDGGSYGQDNPSVRRFASEIYRLGVKTLRIVSGVTADELQALLALISRPLDIIESGGGAVDGLFRARPDSCFFGRRRSLPLGSEYGAGYRVGYVAVPPATRVRIPDGG